MPLTDKQIREGLAQILDTFTCGVHGATGDQITVFANRKMAEMVGRPKESLFGVPTRDFIPRELHGLFQEESKLIDEGDLRARLTALRRGDGTTMPVLVLPMADMGMTDGRTVSFSVILDLGAVMTARHMLYDGKEELRGLLSRIAVDLQAASLLAGGTVAAHPELRHPALAECSRREREVLACLVAGERVPTIAAKLFISQHTVRNHLKSMFRKLGVSSQGELIERVRALG